MKIPFPCPLGEIFIGKNHIGKHVENVCVGYHSGLFAPKIRGHGFPRKLDSDCTFDPVEAFTPALEIEIPDKYYEVHDATSIGLGKNYYLWGLNIKDGAVLFNFVNDRDYSHHLAINDELRECLTPILPGTNPPGRVLTARRALYQYIYEGETHTIYAKNGANWETPFAKLRQAILRGREHGRKSPIRDDFIFWDGMYNYRSNPPKDLFAEVDYLFHEDGPNAIRDHSNNGSMRRQVVIDLDQNLVTCHANHAFYPD